VQQVATPAAKRVRWPRILLGLVIVVAFAVLYALTLRSYDTEGAKSASAFKAGSEQEANRLDVNATVLSVDPIKDEMVVRMEFTPQGDLTADEGWTVSKGLNLYTNSASGKQETVFEKGKHPNPMDMAFNLSGQASDYPFDQHEGQIYLGLETVADAKDGTAAESVPVAVEFYGSLPGLKIAASPSTESQHGLVAIDMQVARSSTVRVFAIAAMIAMWAIALVMLFMVICVIGGRKVELAMFGLASGLIFGFWALRNSLPGTPPVGTLSDFMAFFWAEAIAALSITALVIVWLVRPSK
jgi:hypothetical protein